MLSYREVKSDTACNLECLQSKGPVHEFVGPVKIVLVDVPKKVYRQKKCLSGFIAMANMMIGATVMTVLYFSLSMKPSTTVNLHIILCTFGYQLCFPSAILMISNLNGASSQMKEHDRRFQHLFLQVVGLLCVSAGTVLAFMPGGKFQLILTPHSIAGLAAFGLSALSALQGPIVYCARYATKCGKCSRGTHVLFGAPAFFVSSICFCLGLYFSKSFNTWCPIKEMAYTPILFCFMYTIIVIYSPIVKCLNTKS